MSCVSHLSATVSYIDVTRCDAMACAVLATPIDVGDCKGQQLRLHLLKGWTVRRVVMFSKLSSDILEF